ncbi:DUF6702 family protein [Pleionea mediterranea]|uniref:Uncharacterized protein n=1 Tax=Pleionea mediterranea TaxID=523701 RepID=A0A316FYS1_9GAMM|nr:DUF6702 family protein [Pleionea mediterranea]PWK53854.1 hypothetical protein C8D97_102244 [Pleionea mediterranea]
MKPAFLSLSLLCVVFMSGVLMAHQQKESYTTVNFNQRTSNIEVVHRFYLHDAEHAINRMLDTKADIINNKQSQAAFAQYVKQNFGLRVNKSTELSLHYVGFEVEGKYLWVYQEIPLKDSISEENTVQTKTIQVESIQKDAMQESSLQQSFQQKALKGLWVKMTALQEVWPQQTNQVNFEQNSQVNAIRLKQNDGWKFVVFD